MSTAAPSANALVRPEAPALVRRVLSGYALRPLGTHGITHWARVLENGRRLADLAGVPRTVVELFALLHDSRRRGESVDREHGARAAAFARELAGEGLVPLGEDELQVLEHACRFHASGRTDGELVVQVCWDADRLDLGRVGIEPLRDRLCTGAAREDGVFEWACARGRARVVSGVIRDEWGIELPGGPADRAPSPAPDR